MGPLALTVTLLLSAELRTVQAGPVKLRFVSSDTATVFRIVDQLSGWSTDGWARYRDALPKLPSKAEKELLDRHAAVRERLGWQTTHAIFVTELPIDAAVVRGRLSPEDAATEREVLHAFEERVLAWAKGREDQLVMLHQFDAAELTRFAQQAAKFSGSKPGAVDVFVVPSRTGADGAYSGGRIVLEMPPQATTDPLLHELWHAFAGSHLDAFTRALAGRPRLELDVLSEAIAYAVQPGLFQPSEVGAPLELAVGVVQHSPSGPARADRQLRLALALRPSLERTWQKGALDAYLPTAVAVYEGLVELDRAGAATPYGLVIFGDRVTPRLPITVSYRRFDPDLLKFPLWSSLYGIALVGRGPSAVPAEFQQLFGEQWSQATAHVDDPEGTLELSPDGGRPTYLWWDTEVDGGAERVGARVRDSVFRFVKVELKR